MSNNKKGAEDIAAKLFLSTPKTSKQLICCLPHNESYTDQPYNRKARKLEERAKAWVAVNSQVWERWKHEVSKAVKNRRRWSGSFLVQTTRQYDLVNDNGEPFKVNNDLEPAFARMLCGEVPGAVEYVDLRTSVFERAVAERHEEAR